MKSETWTLSFLPALDDLEYGGELVARDWDPAITDENKMFRGFIKRYEIGSYVKTYLDVKVCRFGLFIYFRFGYGHKTYGTCSPLAKDCSSSIHRGNSADFVTDMMRNILYYRLQDDGNLENAGRKEIIKLFDKIKDKITNDLKGLDNKSSEFAKSENAKNNEIYCKEYPFEKEFVFEYAQCGKTLK